MSDRQGLPELLDVPAPGEAHAPAQGSAGERAARPGPELHGLLATQLRQARLEHLERAAEVWPLLQRISAHYHALDEERRAPAREARQAQAQAIRDSEARYRLLVDHAPDALVLLDADAGRFVEVNASAARLFGMARAELLRVGPLEVSPARQPDGTASAERLAGYLARARAGERLVFEWTCRAAGDRELLCEVRLVSLPGGAARHLCASFVDIAERKRAERIAAAERQVLGQLTGSVALPGVLAGVTRLVESVGAGERCSVSVLPSEQPSAPGERRRFCDVVAPRLEEGMRAWLLRTPIDQRHCPCAAAVAQRGQVLVEDIGADPSFGELREAALAAGVRAVWSTPIKSASGQVLGALGVYRPQPGGPATVELTVMARAAQLAGIAIERLRAEEALRSSEARFRGLFESITEGVFQSTPEGRFLSVNPAFVAILGYASAAELYALPSVAQLYWNPAERALQAQALERHGEIRNAELAMRRRDGQQVILLQNVRVVRDAARRVIAWEGTIADITDRKRAEQQVFAEKERAQVTLQSIGDAVISTDADGRIEYINPVAERLTAWSLEEARGRLIGEVLNLINEETREPIVNPLMGALGRGELGGPADQSVLVTRSGQEVAIQESAAPICDRQGRVIGAVIVFHDVTKERRLTRALSYQARHDALTGLLNRRAFDNRLHAVVDSAQSGEGSYALLYLDLDQFKLVNDTCGHEAGDRLLRDVTSLLQAKVRASDTIARLGGDEFGVLLEGCTLEQATRIADGIRLGIRDYRFVWGASTLSVGASVGVVQIDASTKSVASVLSAADIACYAAKDEGRNRIHIYEADGASQREMSWVSRLTRAVEDNRLELYFQPIVPVGSTGCTYFHELTVRLRDDDGQLVPPGEFIPAAERYNIMSGIDRWVLQQAIRLLEALHRQGRPLPLLAVNLSGTSLNDLAFADLILGSVGPPEIAAGLCFEITETAAVASLAHATRFMGELKSRGCKFALDDFGTGLSSFMYLKTLPVDFLKIHGQFISQVATDPVDRSMVEAISKVGRALGIATVAEWVECPAVLEELRRIGVDFAQGYLLAAPRPIADLGP